MSYSEYLVSYTPEYTYHTVVHTEPHVCHAYMTYASHRMVPRMGNLPKKDPEKNVDTLSS